MRMIVVAVRAWHGVMTHGVMAPRRAPDGTDNELDVNAARFRKNHRGFQDLGERQTARLEATTDLYSEVRTAF